MKLIHFSDTHLGYSQYSKVDAASGVNQREIDVYAAFRRVIDLILEKKPELVIHAGDLFDTARPSNRAIHVALSELKRLSGAGIPIVLISGNHSTPRIASSASIFESLGVLPGVYPVFKKHYEKIRIKDAAVHIVPHTTTEADLKVEIEKVTVDPDAKYNILGLHAGISGTGDYKMGEFNELGVPKEMFSRFESFNYIALGHWHGHRTFTDIPNARYSGSTERFSFHEAGYPKGVVWFDLATRQAEFCPIQVREMVRLGPVDCTGKDAATVFALIEELAARTEIAEKILQLELTELPRATYVQLDHRAIQSKFTEAYQFSILYALAQEAGGSGTVERTVGALPVEFERFLESLELPNIDKVTLLSRAVRYIGEAAERSEA